MSVATSLQLQVDSHCHLRNTCFWDPPARCLLLFLSTQSWLRLIWELLVCRVNWLHLAAERGLLNGSGDCSNHLTCRCKRKPVYALAVRVGRSAICCLCEARRGLRGIGYEDPNFKIHRWESCCVGGMWHGERFTRWSPLTSGQHCCPSEETELCQAAIPGGWMRPARLWCWRWEQGACMVL